MLQERKGGSNSLHSQEDILQLRFMIINILKPECVVSFYHTIKSLSNDVLVLKGTPT